MIYNGFFHAQNRLQDYLQDWREVFAPPIWAFRPRCYLCSGDLLNVVLLRLVKFAPKKNRPGFTAGRLDIKTISFFDGHLFEQVAVFIFVKNSPCFTLPE